MARPLHFRKIGRSRKSFGVRGQMRCAVDAKYLNDLNPRDFLFIEIDGIKVPFQIEAIDRPKTLIKFADIDDPEAAIMITNRNVYLAASASKDCDPDHFQYGELVGYEIHDVTTDQIVGIISSIEQYPGQIMAIVDRPDGALLVPLIEDLIDHQDDQIQRLDMTLPLGFLDL